MKIKFLILVSFVALECCQGQNKKIADNSKTTDSIIIKNRNLLRDYFLCSCIDEGFRNDSLILKKDHSTSVLIEMSDYFPEAFQQTDSLAKRVAANVPISNYTGKKGVMINCITFYNSNKLTEFINNLDTEIDKRKPK